MRRPVWPLACLEAKIIGFADITQGSEGLILILEDKVFSGHVCQQQETLFLFLISSEEKLKFAFSKLKGVTVSLIDCYSQALRDRNIHNAFITRGIFNPASVFLYRIRTHFSHNCEICVWYVPGKR